MKLIHNKFFDLGASIICGTITSYIATKTTQELGVFDAVQDLSKLGIIFAGSMVGVAISKTYIQHLKNKDNEENKIKPYLEEHVKEQNGTDSLDFFKVSSRKPR